MASEMLNASSLRSNTLHCGALIGMDPTQFCKEPNKLRTSWTMISLSMLQCAEINASIHNSPKVRYSIPRPIHADMRRRKMDMKGDRSDEQLLAVCVVARREDDRVPRRIVLEGE